MLIKIGMALLCTYYMYAPEMNRSGKIQILNVPTRVLYIEGDYVLVSSSFKNTKDISFNLETNGVNKYDMTTRQDLQQMCKEPNGK